jgi:hypothetical protein
MESTNITAHHKELFNALRGPTQQNFALFSCFVNGQPTSAIVIVNDDGYTFTVVPLFVAITDGMVITDHDGTPVELEPKEKRDE